MQDFVYIATTADGQTTSGQITAASAVEAVAQLESQGMVIRSLQVRDEELDNTSATLAAPEEQPLPEEPSVDPLLEQRVRELLDRRETLAPALAAFVQEMSPGSARRELRQVADALANGTSAEGICRSPQFVRNWLPLLAGGTGFTSSESLRNIFHEALHATATRRLRIGSLLYPLTIAALAFIVLLFLSVMVVPTFRNIFEDFDMALPGLTLALVDFTDLLLKHPLRLLIYLAMGVLAVYLLTALLGVLRLPGRILGALTAGNSRQVAAMASFMRTLTEALQIGMSTPQALRLAGDDTRQRWLRKEAYAYAESLEQANSGEAIERVSRLPATLQYALNAGPEGSPHVPLLGELSDMYTDRLRRRFDWVSGVLPQLAIIAVAVAVGIVVVALFLPLVELINGLSG